MSLLGTSLLPYFPSHWELAAGGVRKSTLIIYGGFDPGAVGGHLSEAGICTTNSEKEPTGEEGNGSCSASESICH